MKVQFKFDNGTSQIILTPESAREKQLLQLSCSEAKDIVKMASTDDSVVLGLYTLKTSPEYNQEKYKPIKGL